MERAIVMKPALEEVIRLDKKSIYDFHINGFYRDEPPSQEYLAYFSQLTDDEIRFADEECSRYEKELIASNK